MLDRPNHTKLNIKVINGEILAAEAKLRDTCSGHLLTDKSHLEVAPQVLTPWQGSSESLESNRSKLVDRSKLVGAEIGGEDNKDDTIQGNAQNSHKVVVRR